MTTLPGAAGFAVFAAGILIDRALALFGSHGSISESRLGRLVRSGPGIGLILVGNPS